VSEPIPDWVLNPTAAYREIPGGLVTPTEDNNAKTWQQLKLQSELWLNVFVGKVAIAFGGINIFGWKPLEFLADWGQQRIDDAIANYEAATTAQQTANFATTQVTILQSGILASDVSGGISLSDQFSGSSANDLGSDYTRTRVDGPGAGNFGLNGTGRAVWKQSGGSWRRQVYRRNTAMASDYHSVHTIIAAKAYATPIFGDPALAYLFGRMNADGTQGVYLSIATDPGGIDVGYFGSGGFSSVYSMALTVSVGDQFTLVCGTAAGGIDNYQIKQNGAVRTGTNITGLSGSGNRGVGLGARATYNFLFQTTPPELEMWAANDREPTTI
jgi:hypothetical protein